MEFSENPEVKQDGRKTINFGPRKYRAGYRRFCFIVSSVFGVIFVLLIVVTLVITKTSNSKNNVSDVQKVDDVEIRSNTNIYSTIYDSENMSTIALTDLNGRLLLLIDGTGLVAFNYKFQNLSLLYEAVSNLVITTFDVDVGKYIYWGKKVLGDDEKYIIEAFALTEGKKNLSLEERRLKPSNLMFDRGAENLYGIDEDTSNVVLMNLQKGYYAILLKSLAKPHEIVLDSEEGLMFILQFSVFSHSILRANMDGSQVTEIVSNHVTALTIDTSHKRLYWISNFLSIKSSDYEGKQQKSFFIDIMEIKALIVLDDRLFWTWKSSQNTTNLFSCEISKTYTCVEHSTYNIPGNVTLVRGYSTVHKTVPNPCELNNNGCQQLCLLSGRNKSTCGCREDWQLNWDRHSCQQDL